MVKRFIFFLCLLVVIYSTVFILSNTPPALAQPTGFDPRYFSRTVEEYHLICIVYLLDQQTFNEAVKFYFGPKVQAESLYVVEKDNAIPMVFINKETGMGDIFASDLGHEVKHIINNYYKARHGINRFPDCKAWKECRPDEK